MKLLVLTSEPISARQLQGALPRDLDPQDAEVMLVAPAFHENALRFWVSDADDAIARAEAIRRESVEQLGAQGVSASGDTGEADPLDAIEDALKTFDADRIVLFTHPENEQRYREGVDEAEIAERFGRPVDRAQVTDVP
jgi:hypothetical protein